MSSLDVPLYNMYLGSSDISKNIDTDTQPYTYKGKTDSNTESQQVLRK